MTATEFREWIEFARREPIGDLRADYRAGVIASVMASTVSKKRHRPIDFMPFANLPPDDLDPGVKLAREAMAAFSKASSKLRVHYVRSPT